MDKALMQKGPLVSIVMPVYNAEKYLRTAIESILSQSYKHFEFLIIDDGSTDGSKQIIASFTDPRIRFIENPANRGLIYTLNYGFGLAKGVYIARMDADDVSLSSRIEKQVTFMEAHPLTGVCGTGYVEINEGAVPGKKVVFNADSDSIKAGLLFNSSLGHPTVMIRASLAADHKYSEDFAYAEDYELWTRLMEVTSFANLEEILFHYRIHSGQVSAVKSDGQKQAGKMIRQKILDKLNIVAGEDLMQLHDRIANSETIVGKINIDQLEKWISMLLEANKRKQLIDETVFNRFMLALWMDLCSNSSTGLWGYNRIFNAGFSKSNNYSLAQKFKALIKCLTR